MKTKSFPTLLGLASCILMISYQAQATDYWWDSNGTTAGFGTTTGTWGTSAFWSTGTGASGGTAAPALTPTTNADTVNYGGSITSLNYGNGTVAIDAAGVTVNSIVYGAGQTTAINLGTSPNTITLDGTIPTTPAITLNRAGVVQTISSPIAGTLGFTKAGPGILTLSGSNTYTGGTTVSAGTLVFRTLASKEATGTHAFGAGTTLGLGVGGGNFTTTDVDNAFTGTMTGNLSNVTVDATTSVGIDTTAGNLSYTSNISAVSRGLTKLGTNTLTLGTSNAYTGVTTLAGGGTLSAGSLANAGANSSIGAFATSGETGLVLSGGTFSYTGGSVTTDRGFTVNGSNATTTISVGAGVALNLGAAVKNEFQSVNTNGLRFSAAGAGSSITISSLTITAGSNPDFNLVSGSNPNVTIQNLNVTGSNVIHERTGTHMLNIVNINGSSSSGWLGGLNVTGVISGYTGSIFMGGSTMLTGLSTFDAPVVAQQSGTYSFNSIKNVGGGASALGAPTTVANGTIGFGNGVNTPTLRYTGTGDTTNRVLDLRGTATLNLEHAGSGVLTFTGNTTSTASTKTLNLTGSTTGTGEFSGIIADNSATNKTNLSKSGTGLWKLSGNNTYTGTTTVNGGTLAITGATQATTAIAVGASGSLGLDIATPVSISSAAVTLSGTVKVTGTPVAPNNYTLLTASSIAGTPTLAAPITGYSLVIDSGNTLKLNYTGGGSPYDTWSGGAPFDGDANGDGVKNGLAFLLGAGNPDENALARLPKAAKSANGLTLTFSVRNAATRGTAAAIMQWSNNLGLSDPWSANTAAVPESTGIVNAVDFQITPNGNLNDVIATIPSSKAAAGKLFGRLSGNEN